MSSISNPNKFIIAFLLFGVAVVGFMLKLPVVFRGHDRLMHALFYFAAAGFLNLLFNVKNVFIHLAIFAFLYVFGVAIEYAQEYSNRYFQTRIHGRFDPEDISWNLKGLFAFSALWLVYSVLRVLFSRPPEPTPKAGNRSENYLKNEAGQTQLHAVQLSLPVSDIEATLEFYQQLIAFKLDKRTPDLICLRAETGTELCFIENKDFQPAVFFAKSICICLELAQSADLYRQLRDRHQQGLEPVLTPEKVPEDFCFTDLNGYRIDIRKLRSV